MLTWFSLIVKYHLLLSSTANSQAYSAPDSLLSTYLKNSIIIKCETNCTCTHSMDANVQANKKCLYVSKWSLKQSDLNKTEMAHFFWAAKFSSVRFHEHQLCSRCYMCTDGHSDFSIGSLLGCNQV